MQPHRSAFEMIPDPLGTWIRNGWAYLPESVQHVVFTSLRILVTITIARLLLRLVPALERLIVRRAHKAPGQRKGARMSGSNDQQRVTTLVKVVGSVARAIIGSIAAVIVLAAVGLNAAPLIAGAGIAGVAVGFGAQSIFKDFFAGFFILLNPVQFGNCISGVEVRAPQGAPSNA